MRYPIDVDREFGVVGEAGIHLLGQFLKLATQLRHERLCRARHKRHSFATEMARAGVPLPALMKLLGHRTPKMTMRYVDVAQIDLRKTYDHALEQIKPIDLIESPALPTPSISLSTPTTQGIPTLLHALITQIESRRRDATDQQRKKQLNRFVKRIRRYKDDLKKIL